MGSQLQNHGVESFLILAIFSLNFIKISLIDTEKIKFNVKDCNSHNSPTVRNNKKRCVTISDNKQYNHIKNN